MTPPRKVKSKKSQGKVQGGWVSFSGYTSDCILKTACWAFDDYLNLGCMIYKNKKYGCSSFPQSCVKVKVTVEILSDERLPKRKKEKRR